MVAPNFVNQIRLKASLQVLATANGLMGSYPWDKSREKAGDSPTAVSFFQL